MSGPQKQSTSFVLFGALGDLSLRKIFPAWFYLERGGLLDDSLRILGVARDNITTEQFQEKIIDALNLFVSSEFIDVDVCKSLVARIDYCHLDLTEPPNYQKIKAALDGWDSATSYYLAIPPKLFETVCDNLYETGLVNEQSRIVVEKPIGYNLESSNEINDKMLKHFSESQIYRIDHYLGKETVQNLIALRFANSLFSSQWNSKSIEYIEITAAESVGIEDRWGYFDGVGQMRDMVQSHLLQLLCLITMEPPNQLDEQSIRYEKTQVLRALKLLSEGDISKTLIRAQYGDGEIAGTPKLGYLNQEGANAQSETETFVCFRAEIANWRWSGTPIYLRTGKRMTDKVTKIVIHFKSDDHFIFDQDQKGSTTNSLIMKLHPTEGIYLQVHTKRHGVSQGMRLRSDPMSLDFAKTHKLLNIPSGYQRLLLDVLKGNQSLFLCREEIELAWRWCDDAIEAWDKSSQQLHTYPSGSYGPEITKTFIEQYGHHWHED